MKIKGFILIFAAASMCLAESQTWHLQKDGQWQQLSKGKENDFLMAVSQAKQYVSSGETSEAQQAYAKIKKDYPQIAGGKDYDEYVKAEILYSRRKYDLAAASYENFTEEYPQSRFYEAALDREFQIATAYLNGQKRTVLLFFKIRGYEDGSDIMNQIADKAGNAPIAKKALQTVATTDEKRGANYDAYLAWSDMSSRWPTGPTGQEALLGMARSLENDYKGPKFDSSVLQSSRTYYDQYQERYESSASELGIQNKIATIDKALAEKELTIADYYNRTESYKAADYYYEKVIQDFPDSSAAKTAQAKKAEVEKKMSQTGKKKFKWTGIFL